MISPGLYGTPIYGWGSGYNAALSSGVFVALSNGGVGTDYHGSTILLIPTLGSDQLTLFVNNPTIASGVDVKFRVRWFNEEINTATPILANGTVFETSLTSAAASGGAQVWTANVMEWAVATGSASPIYLPTSAPYFTVLCDAVGAPPAGQAVHLAVYFQRGGNQNFQAVGQ